MKGNVGKIIKILTEAINEIDDYFEYSYESTVDKLRVDSILSEMNKKFKEIKQNEKS